MRILAIDATGGAASACVLDDDASEPLALESAPMERGHAEALAPLIERVMKAAPGGFSSLTRIAATIGPGSFTGIRIGLATARAMGVALGVPVVGISTLIAYAGPMLLEHKPGIIVCAIDARHERLYLQAFEGTGRPLLAARVITLREAARLLGSGPVRIAGSGAALLLAEANRIGLHAEIVGDVAAPDIFYVAKLGLLADPEDAPPRPFYLKAPDATPSEGYAVARSEA
jgi:tRNA threonylcarbamoyladenosine biosynthesis protein TsaB